MLLYQQIKPKRNCFTCLPLHDNWVHIKVSHTKPLHFMFEPIHSWTELKMNSSVQHGHFPRFLHLKIFYYHLTKSIVQSPDFSEQDIGILLLVLTVECPFYPLINLCLCIFYSLYCFLLLLFFYTGATQYCWIFCILAGIKR